MSFTFGIAKGQSPILSFQQDSVSLGHSIKASLTFYHSPSVDVFFPESTSNFSPFEFISKEAFPTLTKDTVSRDSVVYTLQSFSIDSIQSLALEVKANIDGDTITALSNTDSLFYQSLLLENGDSRSLKEINEITETDENKSLKLWQIILIGVILFLFLLSLVFNNQLKKWLRQYRFRKKQQSFKVEFKKYLVEEPTIDSIQNALTMWREHMEWIEDHPYTSMTALEIENLLEDDKVSQAVRELESSIFGKQKSDRIHLALHILFNFANEKFRERYWQFKKRLRNE
ncbi:hypothetical protein [Jiulongibacter sp. NS-SX5]|uniref:hypothetical protein n=1 Tax=Jiulongibacter sp. NS-SX5 TaxID=3463854 RepID=UPI00405A33A5